MSEADRLIQKGVRRFCITSPTGGGKTLIVQRIVEWGRPTLILCNRTFLLEQWARGLDENGLPFGLHASGYAPSVFENCQLGMVQTISSRWGKDPLPVAEIVVVDEAHNEKGERMQKLLAEYYDRGATIVTVTATPVDIGHMADELVVAGRPSELFKLGALVPAHTYAPDEPEMKSFKGQTKGLLQFKDEVKEIMLRVIFGRVVEHYQRLNPDGKPTILFAPGVDESRWFCEQFNERGFPWCHIDSKLILLNGTQLPATRENRERLLKASREGETCGISNRFVMREGIDAPWLAHGILACTFGSVCSYLQAGGRLLRAHHGLTHITIQDHGGNFWRHDSLNVDRDWSLEDTDAALKQKHDEVYRTKAKPEPIVCPKCQKVRQTGPTCPSCGFTATVRKRMVIQTDGTLREVRGDVYKPRKVNNSPEGHKLWKQCYYRCKNAKRPMTFNQARNLFLRETGTTPGPDFPLTPRNEADWSQHIADVPWNRLVHERVSA